MLLQQITCCCAGIIREGRPQKRESQHDQLALITSTTPNFNFENVIFLKERNGEKEGGRERFHAVHHNANKTSCGFWVEQSWVKHCNLSVIVCILLFCGLKHYMAVIFFLQESLESIAQLPFLINIAVQCYLRHICNPNPIFPGVSPAKVNEGLLLRRHVQDCTAHITTFPQKVFIH